MSLMRMSPRVLGAVCVLLTAGFLPRPASGQAQQDTLRLLPPSHVRVIAKMNEDRGGFTDYLFWDDLPKETSTLVHDPDTVGWHPKTSTTPRGNLSIPSSGGVYTGTIDRTLTFLVPRGGRVGVGVPGRRLVTVRYNVDGGRENLTGQIDIGQGYTPGQPIRCPLNPGNLDLGFTLSFSAGIADSTATFRLGLEDFEGYHMFRGTQRDGNDLVNIGEVSKEEAFLGEPLDSLYFAAIVPALRLTGVFTLFGTVIDIREVHPDGKLGDNELFWLDANAFNGFTYYYVITTYDRDYRIDSASQGLSKFDHCPVTEGVPYPCPSEIVSVKTKLDPITDLPQIYAVPNPYRSGSSQYATENYHNFPDNKMRFVNVPASCVLRIYTPSGDLVWEFSQTDGSGNVEWDTRNIYEEEVASGVYLYRVEAANGDSMYGRIIIIR
jgi:hypothetical protein